MSSKARKHGSFSVIRKQWFGGNNACLLSATKTRIIGGPKIYNLQICYNSKVNIRSRPVGLELNSHFCELHSVHVSYFSVGVELGGSGHCDYTKIYDLYSWYNYFCGVKISGTDQAQVNFVSFFDCNVGSNGVSVHDKNVKPVVDRGYGFYIATANGVYINNADLSSNETAGIYIDNSITTKQTRGLTVSMLYAEHNKYCNIYYNNGKNASPDNCRSGYIDIKNAYFARPTTDKYFVSDVFIEDNRFVPKTVSLIGLTRDNQFPDGYSPDLELARLGHDCRLRRCYGNAGNNYRVTMSLMSAQTGTIKFSPTFYSYDYNKGFYNETKESYGQSFNVPVTKDQRKTFSFYITFPVINKRMVMRLSESEDYLLEDAIIENVTLPSTIVGKPIEGATRVSSGYFQIYLNGKWRNVKTD